MAYHFLTFVTLLSFAHICNGQIFAITNTETSVSSCQSIDLTWEGGTPPFLLSILDSEPLINVANVTDISARRQTGDVLVSFPSTNARTQTWIVDLPQDITRVSTQLVDSQGLSALPKLFAVNRIAGAQCSSSSSSSTTSSVSSSASSSASSAVSTASASSQSSASPSSTSSSSSESTTSTLLPPTGDVATLPTQTPSSSAPGSAPTTDPDKELKQTNALAVPVPAIIGISVGGAIALVVLIVGIYCFRKQTRTRSDPLEGWNGGYDPESVLKATSRYDGSGKFGSGV